MEPIDYPHVYKKSKFFPVDMIAYSDFKEAMKREEIKRQDIAIKIFAEISTTCFVTAEMSKIAKKYLPKSNDDREVLFY